MAIFQFFKNLIEKFDFFATSQYLRFKSQPEYKTLFGGVTSLFLIVSLFVLFSNKLFDTTQKNIIFSDSSNNNSADPIPFNISTFPQDNFMFGVEIWHHNLNEGKRFFDIVMTNSEFQLLFHKRCKLKLCASEIEIDNFFKQSGPFYFTIYFMNPLINPTTQQYLKYYLQDNNYLIFSQKIGSQAVLFMSEYRINTDQSIWPYNIYQQVSGGIITKYAIKNPYEVLGNSYCSISISKSGDTWVFNRSFQKIDGILSYIGGLFGAITFFLFFIRIYNECSFQIQLGSSLFDLNDQMQDQVLKKYNFFSFFVLQVYKFLKMLNINLNWKKSKYYDETHEEMAKQLDVLYLLKRVVFLEKSIDSILDVHQMRGIHMQNRLTLQEAQRYRKMFKANRKLHKINEKADKQKCLSVPETSPNSSLGQNTLFPGRIKNSFQIQKIDQNRIWIEEKTLASPIEETLEPPLKSRIIEKKSSPYDFDSSETQGDSENESQIITQINKLREQAKSGVGVSMKIYSKCLKNLIEHPSMQEHQYSSQNAMIKYREIKTEKKWSSKQSLAPTTPKLKSQNKLQSEFSLRVSQSIEKASRKKRRCRVKKNCQ